MGLFFPFLNLVKQQLGAEVFPWMALHSLSLSHSHSEATIYMLYQYRRSIQHSSGCLRSALHRASAQP